NATDLRKYSAEASTSAVLVIPFTDFNYNMLLVLVFGGVGL
ncbi:42445_t:CDS:1, partial [Gigaspora margarita]